MNTTQDLQEITPERYVDNFRNLPDFFMLHRHGLYFDACGSNENFFVNEFRRSYRYTALWLEYYLLKRAEYLFEATLKPKVYYKPYAEMQMAYLALAEEVYPRSEEAQINYSSPLSWLYSIDIEHCGYELHYSGYTGQPALLGKSEIYNIAKHICNQLEDVESYAFVYGQTKVTPRARLSLEALDISRKDENFKHDYWYPFLKSEKRFYRKMKNSPLYPMFISEGEVTLKTNGKRGRDKKKRKQKSLG